MADLATRAWEAVNGLYLGLRVTILAMFREKNTIQYPIEKLNVSPRWHGLLALPVDPTIGNDLCIICFQCERVCPSRCIHIEAAGRARDRVLTRFDIEMDKLDKMTIETRLNALIAAGGTASARWVEDAELDARPELVRTMSVAPPRGSGKVRLIEIPGVDLQPCGGTHVASIGEIGKVQVTRIRSEGKRNKRVTLAFAP